MRKRQGKLIVLDGTDGSGKATQTALLIKRLRREGRKVATLDFPQYVKSLIGGLLGKYLRGDLGKPVHPYLVSTIYAADRWKAKDKLLRWLREGRIVILDRYVSANQIHQGARIKDDKERREFLAWLDKLEHEVFGIPRPDLILFLHVPTPISMALTKKKQARKYMGKRGRDQMERDRNHQEAAEQTGLHLARANPDWILIECTHDGQMLPPEEIHDRIFRTIEPLLSGRGKAEQLDFIF